MRKFSIYQVLNIILSIIGVLLILFGDIKTTENFRILSDLIQNILLFNIIVSIFQPMDRKMRIAIYVGIFVLIYDFILETIAVKLNWWYPLGGTQFPPLIIIPLEMVVSFFIIGSSFSILLDFPQYFRTIENKFLSPIAKIFKNEKYDNVWRLLLVLGNAIVGTNGDFSAGNDIWAPGPDWLIIHTFIIWLSGGILTLIVFLLLNKFLKQK